MQTKSINVPNYAAPAAFSPALEVSDASRTLYISGQLGIGADGTSAEGIENQSEIIMSNIVAVLRAADMDVNNLVKLTCFLINSADTAGFVKVRSKYLGSHRPASTMLYAAHLARPELLAEVEAVACK